jgi:hypothetical protein
VHATTAASVAFDNGVGIDDFQFVRVRGHGQILTANDCDLGEQRAGRLPAFGAAADMIVRALAFDRDSDFIIGAVTEQRTARKVCRGGLHTLINRGMYGN